MIHIKEIAAILDPSMIRNLFNYKRATGQDLVKVGKLCNLCNPENLPGFNFYHYMVESPIADDLWLCLIKRDFGYNDSHANLKQQIHDENNKRNKSENFCNLYKELYMRLTAIAIITDLNNHKIFLPGIFSEASSLDTWGEYSYKQKFDNLPQYEALSKNIFSKLATRNYVDDRGQGDAIHAALRALLQADFRNPLICAIASGSQMLVESLISHGADVNQVGKTCKTPLQYILYDPPLKLPVSCVQLLLVNGANPNVKDSNGKILLTYAVDQANLYRKLIEPRQANLYFKLIEHREDILSDSRYKLKLRFILDAMILLIKYGALYNQKVEIKLHSEDVSIIEWSIRHCYTDILRALIFKGADVHSQNEKGETSLYFAVCFGGKPTVQLLLENGAKADVNAVKKASKLAGDTGNPEILFLLLDAGGDPQAAASVVAFNGKTEIMKQLLPRIKVNQRYDGTPILISSILGFTNFGMVKLLLESGADPSQRGRDGTALDYANKASPELYNLIRNWPYDNSVSKTLSYFWKSSSASPSNTSPMNNHSNGQCCVM